jgi:phosphoribosylformylglycinamidine (FGAM) synthase PurS component
MAILAGNSPVQGMRGLLGGLVFRSFRGLTVVTTAPSPPPRSRKQTELQQLYRSKFRDASRYAKALMRDPATKAQYKKKAEKMKLPNAYTAAIAEYMRKTKVESIDTRRYTGKAGGSIAVVARKKDFAVETVQVTITTKAGVEVEKGQAVQNSSGAWIYKSTADTTALEGYIITVDTKDRQGNTTRATHHPGHRPECYHGWKVNPSR